MLQSSQKYDARFSSQIQIFSISDPDPGVKNAQDPGSAILLKSGFHQVLVTVPSFAAILSWIFKESGPLQN